MYNHTSGAAEEKVEEEATPEEEDDAEPELPPIMEEFSEEDWMLAQLRAELHARTVASHQSINFFLTYHLSWIWRTQYHLS